MIFDLPYAFSPDMSLRYENADGSPIRAVAILED